MRKLTDAELNLVIAATQYALENGTADRMGAEMLLSIAEDLREMRQASAKDHTP